MPDCGSEVSDPSLFSPELPRKADQLAEAISYIYPFVGVFAMWFGCPGPKVRTTPLARAPEHKQSSRVEHEAEDLGCLKGEGWIVYDSLDFFR